MPARTDRSRTVEQPSPTAQARMITKSSVVTNLTVRAAGVVPARLDLAHVGTAEQQLGLTLGTVLVYLRAGVTARAVADGWSAAAIGAQSLTPAVAGRRPLLIGPTTVAAMIRFAGLPKVNSAFVPARAGGAVPAMLRIEVGPVTWAVCDATAYTSMLRAWRQAARLLGENPTEDE
ncbi:hypothetical protein GCM10017691_12860 [Pseudonocardia petroleophila]|uniref:Uncharacterized protein n=1 Tax=Pseudonocardia petroleophila TaxID=37331 RepID=A0A7G7MII7_9PSEU|nr:hypothetical protein [Pseudonocardia petroleophila]QNG52598.1 hypothetical protein H6H00_00450 [Pseudonocardia petroleophila]